MKGAVVAVLAVVVLVIAAGAFFYFGVVSLSGLYSTKPYNSPKNENTILTISPVMEFPPLSLCKNTGGEWRMVSAKDYPLSESDGVYNPTTDPQANYKCFCPQGKKWNSEGGCI